MIFLSKKYHKCTEEKFMPCLANSTYIIHLLKICISFNSGSFANNFKVIDFHFWKISDVLTQPDRACNAEM